MARITFLLIALVQFFSFATSYGATIAKRGPPAGAILVKANGAKKSKGEFSKIQDAVQSLPNDGSSQVIYIYGGIYKEQVVITRKGPLKIIGEANGAVTITQSKSAQQAASDEETATLRVHVDNFSMYNVNVKNTFGRARKDGQALALSTSGEKQAYYDCGFYSYQDTILVNGGTQFFANCYIEGAVDYIFGKHGRSLFHKCVLASIGEGYITAHGPSAGENSIIVIDRSIIKAGVGGLHQKVYLGRPWSEYANVAYTSCTLDDSIHPDGWRIWSKDEPHTDHVNFVEYNSQGAGASSNRVSFAKVVKSGADYSIRKVLGSGWEKWVDRQFHAKLA
ncbi:carbohydrate esterase family 8 protein [Moniliophthora roreri MCA 2997]|uniref:Pectinesterase n=2 Tax=Moniliophthora roreri TaxID=221103 RepID=V2WPI1_MONRO|nr:carbohydrate esterase family 8 protein [Moniliophthora roreri MCA 2997]